MHLRLFTRNGLPPASASWHTNRKIREGADTSLLQRRAHPPRQPGADGVCDRGTGAFSWANDLDCVDCSPGTVEARGRIVFEEFGQVRMLS